MDTWFSLIRINSMWVSTADRLSGFTFIYFIVNGGWRNQLMQLTTDEWVTVSQWCAQHIIYFQSNELSGNWKQIMNVRNFASQKSEGEGATHIRTHTHTRASAGEQIHRYLVDIVSRVCARCELVWNQDGTPWQMYSANVIMKKKRLGICETRVLFHLLNTVQSMQPLRPRCKLCLRWRWSQPINGWALEMSENRLYIWIDFQTRRRLHDRSLTNRFSFFFRRVCVSVCRRIHHKSIDLWCNSSSRF